MTQVAVFPTYAVPQTAGPISSAFFNVTPTSFRAMDEYLRADLCRLLLESGFSNGDVCRMTGLSRQQLAQLVSLRHGHGMEIFGNAWNISNTLNNQERSRESKRSTRERGLRLLSHLRSLPDGIPGAEIGREFGWSAQTCRSVLALLSDGGLIRRGQGRSRTNGVIWCITGHGHDAVAAGRIGSC